MLLKRVVTVGTTKPEFEVADVFRKFGAAYRRKYPTSWKQRKVMSEIVNCRRMSCIRRRRWAVTWNSVTRAGSCASTTALTALPWGWGATECDTCGKLRINYCSCKDRHCPKCGAFKKAKWLNKQEALLLPTPYFHVVFTTDHAINDDGLVQSAQE